MSEPSTDEREALLAEHDRQVAERAWDLGNAAGGSRVRRQWSDEPGLPDAENPYRADTLAARPAVDVEGIARVLRRHRKATHMGGRGLWEITCVCDWTSGHLPIGEDDEAHRAHQAQSVVAYLAGESRDH